MRLSPQNTAQSLPGTLCGQVGCWVQKVPGPVPVLMTPGAQGLDGEALTVTVEVSLQLLFQMVTNTVRFPAKSIQFCRS